MHCLRRYSFSYTSLMITTLPSAPEVTILSPAGVWRTGTLWNQSTKNANNARIIDRDRASAFRGMKCRQIKMSNPQTAHAIAIVPYEFLSIVILNKVVSCTDWQRYE